MYMNNKNSHCMLPGGIAGESLQKGADVHNK